MPRRSKFNELWLCSQNLAKWLSPVSGNIYKAYCKICNSNFDINHSGIGCVKSHAQGKRHKALSNALLNGIQTTIPFKGSETQDGNCSTNEEKEQAVDKTIKDMENKGLQPADTIKKFLLSDQVTKAEILWALNTMLTHISSRSGGVVSDIFKIMFPDSVIAEKFQMHKDKLSYVITYGLGPYFQDRLVNDLRKCDYFCFSIDESLNKVAQKGQMDILVRFWNESQNLVSTRYLSSMFLGHSKASDLLDAFTTCLEGFGLPLTKILQIETDGPNVNLKFLKDFDEHIKNEKDNTLLDVGTCSLHVLHGCYKTAHMKSKWEMNDFLRAAYYLFKDFPSRRADYQHFSGSSLFPLKLCAIRWIENSNVTERAIKICPYLKLYVKGVKDHPPATKNFETVSKFLKDELLLAKLYFLQSVTSELETFLIYFQADKPLLPHLYEELALLFKTIASRFLKKDVVKNLHDIMLTDINNKDYHVPIKKIDVGFGASNALSKVTENDKIVFQRECRDFLINLLNKLKIKSPLSKKLVKGLSCFSPKIMLSSESVRSNRVGIALKEFVIKKHLSPIQADCAKSTYLKLCEDPVAKTKLEGYSMKQDRLDEFLMDLLRTVDEGNPLVTFAKKVLTMFHGNAVVERSFSVNKKCVVENLEENSLVAQRSIHSAILHYGSIENIPITTGMITAFRSASGKRNEALKQKRLKQNSEELGQKMAAAELKQMKKRKLEIMQMANDEIEQLNKKIVLTEKRMKMV